MSSRFHFKRNIVGGGEAAVQTPPQDQVADAEWPDEPTAPDLAEDVRCWSPENDRRAA